MVSIICPEVDDLILRAGTVFYAIVIGTMAYHSMILATAENSLQIELNTSSSQFSQRIKCNGGILYGYRIHAIASITFLISDSILGYSKFVEKDERQVAVMVTYYASLIFFALSALSDAVCVKCVIGKTFEIS